MTGTIYLISGANRGIGLSLVANILIKHDEAFVYAGARDPEGPGASALKGLEGKYPGRIAVVRCVSADVGGNAALAKEIEHSHGKVDTVIANAAISASLETVLETPLSTMKDHFHINVLGPLVLFQETYALLKKSTTPRFVTISSGAGSLDGLVVKHPGVGHTAYGSSKAALNWVTRKIHFENEWLVVFPLTPGPVNTDMFLDNVSNDRSGEMKHWADRAKEPDQVAISLLNIIDDSTREKHGGEFYNADGEKVQW